MTEITFYVLPTESTQERHLFACKLVEKSYRSDCFCYLLTDSETQSRVLDDLLWTFRPGSFIPHQLYDGTVPEWQRLILIGSHQPPEPWRHTLLNVSSQFPQDYLQYGRILEILDNSEATKVAGRQRYRQYQQAGLSVTTHKL